MNSIRLILAVLISLLLAACGGGGSSTGGNGNSATYNISGTVSGATASGVTISLTGASTASTTTDASGNFSFTALANGSYTVTPSKNGYSFGPLSSAVAVSGANVSGTNFTATASVAPTYTLSGTVDSLTGVTLTLSGGATGTVSTNSGSYTFTGLTGSTSYTVTPSLAGYTFNPTSATVAIAATDRTVPNFAATANPVSHSISGTVSGAVAQGVTVSLTGASTNSAITAANGSYTFSGLPDGSYTVTPSLTGYTFNPISTAVNLSGADVGGQDFVSTANVAPTYTVTGKVTGPWVEGLTINMSGDATGTAPTNASGDYSFANLPAGSYTFTTSLAGYSFIAGSATVTNGPVVASDIVASSAVPSYSISGTVSYGGLRTGSVMVNVAGSGSPGFTQWSKRVTLTAGSATYTIRGLPAGNYFVTAEMDAMDDGIANASNPVSAALPVSILAADQVGADLSLVDPAGVVPVTPILQKVSPGDSSAFVLFSMPVDANGKEIATDYKISWGTDASTATVGGGSMTFPARGSNTGKATVFGPGMTNGSVLYFKVSALVGGAESVPSPVSGAKTINPTSGGYTVSGTVTFGGTATGGMLVGLYNITTNSVYFTRIPTPVSPQAFSVAGLPAGTYFNFAVIDNNNNGVPDSGDFTNVNSNDPTFPVSGSMTHDIVLASGSSTETITTDFNAQYSIYSLRIKAVDGTKRVVGVTILSGPKLPLPCDTATRDGNDGWANLGALPPTAGDSYSFKVLYSDGTSQILTQSLTGVLGINNVATGLATSAVAAGATVSAPQFSWNAPASVPSSATYTLWLSGGGVNWWSNMPSSQLSVLFNADGGASAGALNNNGSNAWQIIVNDANGNTATSPNAAY